jgi:hypothetical protein
MTVREETLNRFIETIGREKIVALLRKEDLLAALSKEDMQRQLLAEYGLGQLHQMMDEFSRTKSESH